nr:GNAT family N-acetyltransferase [uncultured Caproiciproducens sp.]
MIEINIIQRNKLNAEQTNQIRDLEKICQEYDGLKRLVFLSNEINFDQKIDCFYLLYEEDRLIAFLSLFIPLAEEAEVSAYTLPECRERGYFTLLFMKAAEELKKYKIYKILFVHEPSCTDAKRVLEAVHANYAYSEYLLTFDRAGYQKCGGALTLKLSESEDIPDVAALDSQLFGNDYGESVSIVTKSVNSPTIKAYSALLGSERIGLCNANMEGGNVSIFGVGISPAYQGKGYGREMLNRLLEQLMHESGEISLEVSSSNGIAYHLYITSGFQIKTQFDYDLLMLPV